MPLELIQRFEGCRLKAYRDEGDVLTIGWGHTGPEVKEGLVWTQADADAQLALDVGQVLAAVAAGLTRDPSDSELCALTSFAFNVGVDAFRTSHLRRYFNLGLRDHAADEFLRWNHVNGTVSAGLTRRRHAERAVFLGDYSAVPPLESSHV